MAACASSFRRAHWILCTCNYQLGPLAAEFPVVSGVAAVDSWFDISNNSNRPFYFWNQLHYADLRPVTSHSHDFIDLCLGIRNLTELKISYYSITITMINSTDFHVFERQMSPCKNTISDRLVIIFLTIVSSLLFASLIYTARKRLRSCAGKTIARSITLTICSN